MGESLGGWRESEFGTPGTDISGRVVLSTWLHFDGMKNPSEGRRGGLTNDEKLRFSSDGFMVCASFELVKECVK